MLPKPIKYISPIEGYFAGSGDLTTIERVGTMELNKGFPHWTL
jgi:hypothetical protein